MNIRPFISGPDEALLLPLRRAVWGETHLHNDGAFFSWLFQRNPDGAGGGVLLEDEGRAVGFAGLATRQLMHEGSPVSIALGMDYMMHPEYRNGFAASRLANFWAKSISEGTHQFALCFPNSSSYKILTGKKVGWQRVCDLSMLARPLGTVGTLPGKLKKIPRWIMKPAFRIGSLMCSLSAAILSPKKPAGEVVEITQFDTRFDALWAAAKIQSGGVRNAAHLNWRYVEHPLYQYKTFAWVCNDRVAGYVVVTQREVFDIPAILVVDALSDVSVPGVIEALIGAVAEHAQGIGARIMCTQVIRGSTLSQAFQRAGMLAVPDRLAPKTFTLTAHGLGRPLPSLNSSSWYFTWGDMDVI